MPTLLDDDWPDFDLHSAFSDEPAKLRRWVARSPRRSLSSDGTRLVAARRRRGGPVGVFVTNMAPEEGSAGIESLDLVHAEASSRVIFPLGVTVSSVRAHDDLRVTLAFAFEEPIQHALGVTPVLELTVPRSALVTLPEPWPAEQGVKMLDAFAALIVSAAPDAPALAVARAEAFVARERATSEDRARRDAERVVQARRDAERRSARVPLGSGKMILEAAAREIGWTGDAWTAVRTFARPALALVEDPALSTAEVGRSRIGGAPDLPAGVAWPTVGGELLSFVLQLALDDLPPLGRPALPRQGLLSLFVGCNDSTRDVEHLVLHALSSSSKILARAKVPRGALPRPRPGAARRRGRARRAHGPAAAIRHECLRRARRGVAPCRRRAGSARARQARAYPGAA